MHACAHAHAHTRMHSQAWMNCKCTCSCSTAKHKHQSGRISISWAHTGSPPSLIVSRGRGGGIVNESAVLNLLRESHSMSFSSSLTRPSSRGRIAAPLQRGGEWGPSLSFSAPVGQQQRMRGVIDPHMGHLGVVGAYQGGGGRAGGADCRLQSGSLGMDGGGEDLFAVLERRIAQQRDDLKVYISCFMLHVYNMCTCDIYTKISIYCTCVHICKYMYRIHTHVCIYTHNCIPKQRRTAKQSKKQ